MRRAPDSEVLARVTDVLGGARRLTQMDLDEVSPENRQAAHRGAQRAIELLQDVITTLRAAGGHPPH